MRIFTPEDLIAYYYGEFPATKSKAIALSILQHWPTREKFSVVQKAAAQLDQALVAPRPSAVDRILQYSVSPIDHPSC
jgi:hypothetical protein